MTRWVLLVILGLLATLFLPYVSAQEGESYSRSSGPAWFSYDELVTLSTANVVPYSLIKKLRDATTTPFVNNEAYYHGARPFRPTVEGLGPSLRVVQWNIERGFHLDAILQMLKDPAAFLARVQEEEGQQVARERLQDQMEVLATADVWVLNEVDWGMKRTEYRNVVAELGQALNMNWAYALEFLEIDPLLLGLETFEEVEDPQERQELVEATSVDRDKVLAMHGTAVLSRYPIRQAQALPFKLQGYDWYEGEKNLSKVEQFKRQGAGIAGLTESKILREMRRGGRTHLLVTLDVGELEEGRLTVSAPHLENRTKPKNRRLQMEEVLESVRSLLHPVIIAGDLNTTLDSTAPTSGTKMLTNKFGSTDYWVNKGVKYATGVGLAYDLFKKGFKSFKNQSDPTAMQVRFLAPNPERGLFDLLEGFRFEDGTMLDFRGDPQRTVNGTAGTLANSNQRASKGFEATFQLGRTVGAKGKYKLDWILVKAYSEDPNDPGGTFRFAPHFARTMTEVNFALGQPLSDHTPISVDLPFDEPPD